MKWEVLAVNRFLYPSNHFLVQPEEVIDEELDPDVPVASHSILNKDTDEKMVQLNVCNHQAVAAAMEAKWRRLMVTIRRINHLRDSFMRGTPLGTFTSTQQLLPAVSHHSGSTHIDPVRCGGSRREGSLRLLMQHLDLRDAVSLLVDLLHPRTFLPIDLLQLPD